MMEEDFKMVRKYGKVFGVFDGMQPNLIVTDAELIRNIFIKDSNIFLNHLNLQDPEDKRFRSVRKMVFFLRNKEWKDVRLSITKAFSPSNIKLVNSYIPIYLHRPQHYFGTFLYTSTTFICTD